MNGRAWSDSELEILKREYPEAPAWRIAGKLGRKEYSVYHKACALGLKKSDAYLQSPASGRMIPGSRRGEPTRFRAGNLPHNKGKKGWQAGGRAGETKFKPGSQPHNWVPIGSERITKDGILQRKVTDAWRPSRDWKSVHSLLWEEHFGPIPKGHIVIFRDGNQRNIVIENLECISRRENMKRNTIHNLPQPLADVIRMRGVLNRRIRERMENEKQDRGSEKPPVRHHRGAAR
jgi:hypothetical protein